DCQYLFFTIKEIENGYAKEMIYAMKQDGYTLVDRNEFAGFKDKNSKEIYEGDTFKAGRSIGVIVFEDGRYKVKWQQNFDDWNDLFYIHASRGEVIGNI